MAAFKDIENARRSIEQMTDLIPRSHGSGPNWEKNRDLPMTIGECCRSASISYSAGVYLYNTIRRTKPETVIELGTCLGISAFYIALGLAYNNKGTLYTIESEPRRVAVAKQYKKQLKLDRMMCLQGFFEDTTPPILDTQGAELAFIDGSHTYEKTLEYYRMFVDHPRFQGRIIFDDRDRSGVAEAITDIVQDPAVLKGWKATEKLFVVELKDEDINAN